MLCSVGLIISLTTAILSRKDTLGTVPAFTSKVGKISLARGTNWIKIFLFIWGFGLTSSSKLLIVFLMALASFSSKNYPLGTMFRYDFSQLNKITPPPQFKSPQIYFFSVVFISPTFSSAISNFAESTSTKLCEVTCES